MPVPSEPPAAVRGYASALAGRLRAAAGGQLRAAYLHGSAVLGGWQPGRSDVDMLFVLADGAPAATVTTIGEALTGAGDGCPGRELEASVVTVSQARSPAPPWPFLLHVTAGPGKPARVVRPGGSARDPDLIMHYAACRAAGWAACGPPPGELIGAVLRRSVLAYLADELGWGLAHGSEAYAVLNACRARVYLAGNRIVSKIEGGETALRHGTGPAGLIERALAQQRGSHPGRPPGADAAGFVRATAAQLRTAAGSAGPEDQPPARR